MVTTEWPVRTYARGGSLFILYTSGFDRPNPRVCCIPQPGYLVFASRRTNTCSTITDGDIYWCTADVGWVTGHSYILYGPLANGATTLMFEGVPNLSR